MTRELLQQALDELEMECPRSGVITAIRAALAQPEAEPVAEVYRAHFGGNARNIGVDDVRKLRGAVLPAPGTLLYPPPVAPAPVVPLLEVLAKAIYLQWNAYPGYVPWQDGGNSNRQDDARSIAREVLAASPPAPAVAEPLSDEQVLDAISVCKGIGGRIVGDGQLIELVRSAIAKFCEVNGITGGCK